MRIGIIGGGQLAWMLIDAAHQLGHTTACLDPNELCTAFHNSDICIKASYDDQLALERLAKVSDVITYEFENIKASDLHHLVTQYHMPQGEKPLYLSQNRLREKKSFVDFNIPTCKFSHVLTKEDLITSIQNIGLPGILKTIEGGYDGKGQYRIQSFDDISQINFNTEYIYEEWINFDYEMSVIAVRGLDGKVICFPVTKNVHKNGILHICYADRDYDETGRAKQLATNYLEKNNLFGIVTIEMFQKGSDIYFNEIAPRPHNSGHYTIDGCNVSQYTEACKSLLGSDLTVPKLTHKTYMVNILGQHMKNLASIKNDPLHKKIYLYEKDARPNRKMGHITFIDCSEEDVLTFVEKYIE